MLNISRQTGTGSCEGGSACIHENLICLLTSYLKWSCLGLFYGEYIIYRVYWVVIKIVLWIGVDKSRVLHTLIKKRLMLIIELSFFAHKWNDCSQILFDSWWPWPLTFGYENVYSSSSSHDLFTYQVWRRSVEKQRRYRGTNPSDKERKIIIKLELNLSGNPTGRSPSSPEKKFLRCVEAQKVLRYVLKY